MRDDLHADDSGFVFCSRSDVEEGTTIVCEHFAKFGLMLHVGSGDPADNKSKTEAQQFPADPTAQPDAGHHCIDAGVNWVKFTDKSCHLGSIFNSMLTDTDDVDKRLRSAAAAFGALRKHMLTSRDCPLDAHAGVRGVHHQPDAARLRDLGHEGGRRAKAKRFSPPLPAQHAAHHAMASREQPSAVQVHAHAVHR